MTGARVLVVEDESLLAETLCDLMQDAGCEPTGPAAIVAAAYALRRRGIPLLFLTSYEQRTLPQDLGDAILVEKPFSAPLLIEIVRRLAMV
jgi:CheY-like chemotaxis protein